MKLKGQVALVTGGSAGIGEAIAIRFATEGATIGVVASSNLHKSETVVSKISELGGTAKAFCADVAHIDQINTLVRNVVNNLGGIDILVNCAGIVGETPAGETSEAAYDRIMDINVKGTFFCINAVTPLMKKRGAGNIINISSIGGLMGSANLSIYCASKAGVIYLTKALACELAPHGIHVNTIAPGHTATPGNKHLRTRPEHQQYIDSITKRTPSGRTYSDPDDIARAAVFLASEDGRAMHGSVLLLDEGYTAGI